jgi:hypothetical protein
MGPRLREDDVVDSELGHLAALGPGCDVREIVIRPGFPLFFFF